MGEKITMDINELNELKQKLEDFNYKRLLNEERKTLLKSIGNLKFTLATYDYLIEEEEALNSELDKLNEKLLYNFRNRFPEEFFNSCCEELSKIEEPNYQGDQDERDNEVELMENTFAPSKTLENDLSDYHEKRDREEKFSMLLLETFLQYLVLIVSICSLTELIKEIL